MYHKPSRVCLFLADFLFFFPYNQTTRRIHGFMDVDHFQDLLASNNVKFSLLFGHSPPSSAHTSGLSTGIRPSTCTAPWPEAPQRGGSACAWGRSAAPRSEQVRAEPAAVRPEGRRPLPFCSTARSGVRHPSSRYFRLSSGGTRSP